jgi:hypothetical protein
MPQCEVPLPLTDQRLQPVQQRTHTFSRDDVTKQEFRLPEHIQALPLDPPLNRCIGIRKRHRITR